MAFLANTLAFSEEQKIRPCLHIQFNVFVSAACVSDLAYFSKLWKLCLTSQVPFVRSFVNNCCNTDTGNKDGKKIIYRSVSCRMICRHLYILGSHESC